MATEWMADGWVGGWLSGLVSWKVADVVDGKTSLSFSLSFGRGGRIAGVGKDGERNHAQTKA